MLDAIDPDPQQALLKIVLAVVVVGGGILVWTRLAGRIRRLGGGRAAEAVVGVAVAVLLAALYPELLPFDLGLLLLIAALILIYRPEQVIRMTGGPRPEWLVLREGRELALLVRERGGPEAAARDPEVHERLAALDALERPSTAEYLRLVRATLLADPAAPGQAEVRARLAEADAALRASLGARPAWERELEARARGERTGGQPGAPGEQPGR